VIVIDDGSTDDSVQILRDYERQHQCLRVTVNSRNLGALENMGKLLSEAKCDYYYAGASDDFVLPGFFKESLELLERYKDAGLCSTLSDVVDESGRSCGLLFFTPFSETERKEYYSRAEVLELFIEKRPWIQGNATIYRRGALVHAGGFRPELGSFCDGFVQQLIGLQSGVCFIPKPLASWRRMRAGFSRQTIARPETAERIKRAAFDLMVREYASIFPRAYAELWKKRWNYQFFDEYSDFAVSEWRSGLRLLLNQDGRSERLLLKVSITFVDLTRFLLKVCSTLLLRFREVPRIGLNGIKRVVRLPGRSM
jgi:glycosyltransferase involved in cell wall biosynthesis